MAYRLMAMLDRPSERGRLVVWDWEAGVSLVALDDRLRRRPRPARAALGGRLAGASRARGLVDFQRLALRQPNDIAPAWGALLRDVRFGDGCHDALLAAARAWLTRAADGAPRVALPPGAGRGAARRLAGRVTHLPDRPRGLGRHAVHGCPVPGPRWPAAGRILGAGPGGRPAGDRPRGRAPGRRRPLVPRLERRSARRGRAAHERRLLARGNARAALATTEVIDSLPPEIRCASRRAPSSRGS
ncbi:MAG: hypothetical protein U0470_13430 [Anaerolineae bacterium]